GRLDVADLLQQRHRVAGADRPVEEVHVLHQPHGVGGEAEAPPAGGHLAGPHVVARVAQLARQHGGELAHEERQRVGHLVSSRKPAAASGLTPAGRGTVHSTAAGREVHTWWNGPPASVRSVRRGPFALDKRPPRTYMPALTLTTQDGTHSAG